MARRITLLACALPLTLLIGGCESAEVDSSVKSFKTHFPTFDNEVYPVLARDCGFNACHGAEGRTFRIWAPGRVRAIDEETGLPREAFDAPHISEIASTHSLARSMIDPVHPGRSLLLRKPLAVEAGGAGHEGVDQWGRDVYRTTEDAGYQVLLNWVFSLELEGTMDTGTTAMQGTPQSGM